MKKIFLIVCVSIFVVTLLISAVFLSISASEHIYSGECGVVDGKMYYNLDPSSGTLTISGEGQMKSFSPDNDDNPWFNLKSSIKRVVIEQGVLTVGNYAFYGYTNVDEIHLPEGLTMIGNGAFSDTSISSLDLPSTLTRIGNSAFYNCHNLTEVYIPKSVTYIDSDAFNRCMGLKNITVDENNRYYQSMDGVLYGSAKQYLITYPAGRTDTDYSFPIETISTFGRPFAGSMVQNIHVHKYVKGLYSSSFIMAYYLGNINVDADNPYYTSKNGILFNKDMTELIKYPPCKGAKNYSVPTTVKKIIEEAFFGCYYLENVDLPEGLESIYYYAFSYTPIRNFRLPSTVVLLSSSLAYMEDLENIVLHPMEEISSSSFYKCEKLENVYFCGTEEEWNSIVIKEFQNECLFNANIIFNSSPDVDLPGNDAGDINSDGGIDSKDAVLLAQCLAGWNVSFDKKFADCNGDSEVDAKDAVLLAQFLAGWKVTLKNQ